MNEYSYHVQTGAEGEAVDESVISEDILKAQKNKLNDNTITKISVLRDR